MPKGMSFLSSHEQELFGTLETALDDLTENMRERLPQSVKQAYWVRKNISPAPWESLYHEHLNQGDDALVLTLSILSMVAEMTTMLDGKIKMIEDYSKPPITTTDLKTAKTRRVEL